MTEQEWLQCEDVEAMLSSLNANPSERKMRLFTAACCRSIWHQFTEHWCRSTVELAERIADRQATERERAYAWNAVVQEMRLGDPEDNLMGAALTTVEAPNPTHDGNMPLFSAAMSAAEAAGYAFAYVAGRFVRERYSVERRRQMDFLRDIIRNLFLPVSFQPTWRTSTVTNLAQAIYDDRHMPSGLFDNQRMGILADALEEAGCDNRDILDHC
jgi:hypothetical protein